jgi:hypothetical protein
MDAWNHRGHFIWRFVNPFTTSCQSSHTLVNGMLNNFWSTESIFNQFRVFLKTLNALCVCLQCKHPRSIKRFIRSDKPITSVFRVKSQKCDFGAEPRCRLFATSAGKGLKLNAWLNHQSWLNQMTNTARAGIHRGFEEGGKDSTGSHVSNIKICLSKMSNCSIYLLQIIKKSGVGIRQSG